MSVKWQNRQIQTPAPKSPIHNSQKSEEAPMPTDGRMDKQNCSVQKMECYSPIKGNTDICYPVDEPPKHDTN